MFGVLQLLGEDPDSSSVAADHSLSFAYGIVDCACEDRGIVEVAVSVSGIFLVGSSFEDQRAEGIRYAEPHRIVVELDIAVHGFA